MRRIERTAEIFARRQIDCRFAANRGINHGKQGCGNLHIFDPAQIGCRAEAAQIPDHTAAQRNQPVRAGNMLGGKMVQNVLVYRKTLGGFPMWNDMRDDGKACILQRIGHRFSIQRVYRIIGNNAYTASFLPIQRKQLLSNRGQQPRSDFHFIGIGCMNCNRCHFPSTSSLRCLP